jgi:cobalt-zinc-cadmium efflux system outer membrane protein
MSITKAVLLAAAASGWAWAQALTLEELERMALVNHPTLGQAAANVTAAAGRARQAGLYPNPTLHALGDEIAGGSVIRGGELGGGFSQRIVTAGKLGLSRQVANQETRGAEAAAEAQRYRVLNTVRILYYQALGNQRLIEVRAQLAQLARQAVQVSRELANVGQADQPDLAAAEIEAERIELALLTAQFEREQIWRQMAAAVNNPTLTAATLEGDLESLPQLDVEQALAAIYSESPELRAAEAAVQRSELALRRAKVEKIPDVVVSGGVRYNRELLEIGLGGAPRPVGKEGFFDISVEIPIFNRNQGNVAAAEADLARARLEVDRTRLALRARLANAFRQYQSAMAAVSRYRTTMIPRAQQAFDLYLSSFRRMGAAYPQALIAQRNLFQLQEDYVQALVSAWEHAVEIQGLLLTNGFELYPLEASAGRMTAQAQANEDHEE